MSIFYQYLFQDGSSSAGIRLAKRVLTLVKRGYISSGSGRRLSAREENAAEQIGMIGPVMYIVNVNCRPLTTFPKFIPVAMSSFLVRFISWFRQSKQGEMKLKKATLNEQIDKSIEDFKNRTIHKTLTTEIIDATSDDELLQTVFDNLSAKFPKDRTKEYETVVGWTMPQQAIYMIWHLEAEVNNGGLNQYYVNTNGRFAEFTPDSLGLVGAMNLADLMIRANNIYKTQYEEINKYQDGTVEGFSKSYEDNPLNKLDNEFGQLADSEHLEQLKVDFIRTNKKDFIDK